MSGGTWQLVQYPDNMRRFFITIIALYVIVEPASCFDMGKDGFNIYKDYLRSRNDDILAEEADHGDRSIYYFRTPMQLYPGLLPAIEQEYIKNNENIFKNHMMNKEAVYVELPRKRTSKTALSLMMQHRLDPYYSEIDHYCWYGK